MGVGCYILNIYPLSPGTFIPLLKVAYNILKQRDKNKALHLGGKGVKTALRGKISLWCSFKSPFVCFHLHALKLHNDRATQAPLGGEFQIQGATADGACAFCGHHQFVMEPVEHPPRVILTGCSGT